MFKGFLYTILLFSTGFIMNADPAISTSGDLYSMWGTHNKKSPIYKPDEEMIFTVKVLKGDTSGERGLALNLFVNSPAKRYRRRGTKISNGWNDEIDDVNFYPEVQRPISGYTMLGELL